MTASDIPEMPVRSALAFARALVQVIACDRAVQARIREDFTCHIPDLQAIRDIRARVAREKARKPRDIGEKGIDPRDSWEALGAVSKRFVQALERERALSADLARYKGALDSPYLTSPELVARSYEREVKNARGCE